MLLDEIMPAFDFGNRHTIVIAAPPKRVSEAMETTRLDSPVIRVLFRLRGLQSRRGTLRETFTSEGFRILMEKPGEEVVVGVAGRFWTFNQRPNLQAPSDARTFVAFNEPGCAKAAMNFRVEPLRDGGARLTTETRVACVDRAAYRSFAPYWMLIRPFSGWIRREMLRGIRNAALRPAQLR
jgi:hypothetical protein